MAEATLVNAWDTVLPFKGSVRAAVYAAVIPEHRDDCIQYALLYLYEKVQLYSAAKSALDAYVRAQIRYAIAEYKRSHQTMRRTWTDAVVSYNKIWQRLANEHNRTPTDEEVCAHLGEKHRNIIHSAIARYTQMSYDYEDEDGDECEIYNSMKVADNVSAQIVLGSVWDYVRKQCLTHYNDEHLFVVYLYWRLGVPMKSVAQAVGCCESRISQMVVAVRNVLDESYLLECVYE